MKNLETRIEKLESQTEVRHPEKLIIFKLQYDGVRDPTDEEIEAAKKKFLKEHPGYKGHIVLDFKHLGEDITLK
ncbi:MAG TPA: hypothetical protein G4O06_07890 [Dehalococcoidia bacterium]|jgi:hypothetical protein|nr:hypothetical protein [Dehalococcoidia bacterium]